MSKKRILFVVSDFYHNGAQREMYEFDLALDKNKFEINILSLAPLNLRNDLPDYFYEKHKNLGTKILFYDEHKKVVKKNIYSRILNKCKKLIPLYNFNSKRKSELKIIFDSCDKVVFMGEYTYQYLLQDIPPNYFKNILIFIMSFRFQNENYRNFPKDNKYSFVGVFENKNQVKYEFDGFLNFNYNFVPLPLKVTKEFKKWNFRNSNVKKIGIFTRLHRDKPLDPFFYAYQILLKQNSNIELHVFGVGNYKSAGYDRYLNNLDLVDNVFFRGHQDNMKQTIIDEKLDLVWFQGYNNIPAGYAALETSLTGVPQLFWDFFPGNNETINSMDIIYPHFKDLLSFVEATNKILFDEHEANELSSKQFNDVFQNRDITKYIDVIHNLLESDDK